MSEEQRSGREHSGAGSDGQAAPRPASVEREALDLLWEAHRRLADRANGPAPSEVARASFCTDWSVAQVFSHLGSGAQIGALALAAAREGAAAPDPWLVWNVWDVKPPHDMVTDFVTSDRAYLQALDEVVPMVERGERLVIPIDGRPWPLGVALTARVVEVALHEWDVAVAGDPSAEVDPAAAAFVLRAFPLQVAAQGAARQVVERLAPLRLRIEVGDPSDRLHLNLATSGAHLSRENEPVEKPDAVLSLPNAAAWMRLVSGRWRAQVDDTRAQVVGGVAFADLRQLFPGF